MEGGGFCVIISEAQAAWAGTRKWPKAIVSEMSFHTLPLNRTFHSNLHNIYLICALFINQSQDLCLSLKITTILISPQTGLFLHAICGEYLLLSLNP